MKSKFLSIKFFARKKKNNPNLLYLLVRITYQGKRTELSLNREFDANLWDDVRKRFKGYSKLSTSNNVLLEEVKFQLLDIHRMLEINGETITSTIIKKKFLGVEEKPKTLLELISYHNEVMQDKLREGTLKNYRSTLKCLGQFLRTQMKVDDLELKYLNYQFVIGFEKYLKEYKPATKVKCTNNGAMKHLERLKKLSKFATRLGWIKEDTLADIKLEFQKSERQYLNQQELRLLNNAHFKSDSLNVVRDLFLFSCYTGLAFSDISALRKQHIMKVSQGKWIHTKRIKTDEPLRIPLLPKALLILNKYSEMERVGERLLPFFTNQMINRSLKQLCKELGITKRITFHSARHTFATTVTLSNGMPIETVSKLLGHTKIRTTQIYARVLENKIETDMETLAKLLG